MKTRLAMLALALGLTLGGDAQAQLGALFNLGRAAAEAGVVAEAANAAATAAKLAGTGAKAAEAAAAANAAAKAAEAARLANAGAKATLAVGLAAGGLDAARAGHLNLRIGALRRHVTLLEQAGTEDAVRSARLARDYITELLPDDLPGQRKRHHLGAADDTTAPTDPDVVDLMLSVDKQRQVVLRPIAEVSPSHKRFRLVSASVKAFGKAFQRGAADPHRYLNALSGAQAQLKVAWLAVPANRRVFIIGSGKDAGTARALKARYRAKGVEAFFYDFCAQAAGQLCATDAVGAFFATAGQCVLLDSANAQLSQFISLELALAKHLQGLGPSIVVLTPSEVLVPGRHTIEVAHFASQGNRND